MAKALSSIVGSPQDRPPTSIGGRNVTSRGAVGSAATLALIGEQILSGALTANTYKSILTLSVPGVLKLCSVWQTDATARQVGLKIVIDGVTAFDLYAASSSSANTGINGVGSMRQGLLDSTDRVPFNTLDVQVKSSLTETDKVAAMILYDLVQ